MDMCTHTRKKHAAYKLDIDKQEFRLPTDPRLGHICNSPEHRMGAVEA